MQPMLAKSYEGQNPAGWWMSEKLDGVRAIWDGKQLLTRTGKIFHAPDWFLKGLPKNKMLDGELWEGRGLFQQTVGKVRAYESDWRGVKYLVFDVITNEILESRFGILKKLNLPAHVQIVKQYRCQNRCHLSEFEDSIIDMGGEGIMLREPESFYEHKRSKSMLKVKRFQTQEAIVIDYEKGKGRNQRCIGALICRFGQKLIKIGTGLNDELRRTPPAIGTRVTFSFFELTSKDMPRFPSFVACRNYE